MERHSIVTTYSRALFRAWCSGASLLASFGFPYQVDADIIAAAYPWLPGYTQQGCPPPVEVPATGTAAESAIAPGNTQKQR